LILTTPRHGQFYRAITVPAGGPSVVAGSTIKAACGEFGVEFVGPLPAASASPLV